MLKINNYLVFIVLAFGVINAQALNLNEQFNAKNNNNQTQKKALIPITSSQQVERYVLGRKAQYNQWVLQCMNGNVAGNEKCNLIHQIKNKSNQQVLKIEALKIIGDDVILFYLPLGAYLPAGAKLIIGESEYLMPITTCLVSGCQAKIKPNGGLNRQLENEAKAIVQLLSGNQKQKINIEFSLMGYSKGSQEIK